MSRRPMTPEDLWTLPRVGAPAPSPDGSRLVVPVTTYSIEDNEGRTRLWLVPGDLRQLEARSLTSSEISATAPAWSPDGLEILFLRKPGGDPKRKGGPKFSDDPQVYRLRIDGGEPERLTDLRGGAGDPKWFPDGRRIAFIGTCRIGEECEKSEVKANVTEDRVYRLWDRWLTGPDRQHVYALDLKTSQTMDLTPALEGWMDPVDPVGCYDIAPDGSEICFHAVRSLPPHDPLLWGIFLAKVPKRVREDARVAKPRQIVPASLGSASQPRYSPDGSRILHGVRRDVGNWADRTRLAVYDRIAREYAVLTENWPLSAQEWAWSAKGESVYCTADLEGRGGLFQLAAAKNKKRSAGVPRELVRGGTFAALRAAAGRVFLQRSSLREPPEIHSLDAAGSHGRQLTSFCAPLLRKLELGRVEEFTFMGADSAAVQMWAIHPPKSLAKKSRPPLVHLIHGGPHGSFGDVWHWRWNSQVVAARGYVVACVNFHGSSGWGQEFASSIVGEWGDKPFVDVMNATDFLVKSKRVSPKRHAAAGGSYGGYLVSWIATRTDRFRCLINHAGVSDIQQEFAFDMPYGYERMAGGSVWENQEGLDRFNPVRHAAGFKTPMLLLHGEKDYRVPYYQALETYNIYKALGLEARLVCYPDENHWILKPQNSLHWYGEFLGWLKRWL